MTRKKGKESLRRSRLSKHKRIKLRLMHKENWKKKSK